MGVDSDAAFGAGEFWRDIRELERRIRRLESARTLENASIGRGGLRIHGGGGLRVHEGGDIQVGGGGGVHVEDGGDVIVDGGAVRVLEDGSVRLILGTLPSGAHGLAAVDDNGRAVELAALAFGIRSESVPDAEDTDSDAFGDLATVGPVVADVPVGSTGRVLVSMSARLQPGPNNIARMGVEVSGATVREPVTNETLGAGAVEDSIDIAATRTILLEGLTPGVHTFTAKYASVNLGTAFFSARNLTVQPF